MVKRLRLGLLILALVAALAAAPLAEPLGSATPRARAQDVVSAENCAVTSFDIAGPGNYSVGGASGEALLPGIAPDQVVDASVPALQTVTEIGPQPVAILVIDDFFEYRDEIPHGRLVSDLLKAMIQANPVYDFEPSQPVRHSNVWVWDPGEGYGTLLIVEVDTENFNTGDLRDRIESVVTMVRQEFGINRLVLNMSFMLVPCVTPDYDLNALREGRVKRETDHVSLLGEIARSRHVDINLDRPAADVVDQALNDDAAYRAVTVAFTNYALRLAQPDPGAALDPLHDYIRSLTGAGAYWNSGADPLVFAVGSAGDMGRSVASFAPAAWPEVASASARIGTYAPWVSSNRGQVILPGGLFPLGDLYLIGTSFSAPVLSMNIAFYLTHDAVCADPPLTLAVPRFLDAPLARTINRQCRPPFAPITH